jgi:hypothetical protein
MRDFEPGEPTPALLTGTARVLASLALLVLTLAMTIAVYGGWLSGGAEDAFRFGLPFVLGAAALAVGASERSKAFRPLLLSLLGVSLGFAGAHLMAGQPAARASGSSLAVTHLCLVPSRILSVMPWASSSARKPSPSEAVAARALSL